MKKITIVSGIQVINNPRVVKEANLLSRLGYEVEVIGAVFDLESKGRIQEILNGVNWHHISVVDFTAPSFCSRLKCCFLRIKYKAALLKIKWFSSESKSQLGNSVNQILEASLKSNADLYIVHLEQALWVGCELIKQGKKVAIDVEDWYSEDCLPEDRALRPIKLMAECESYLLNNVVYSTTTSKALAQALKDTHKCALPKVVYNSFPIADREMVDMKTLYRKSFLIPSIIWFSQTIGPGRGLEELVEALNKVNHDFELHLIGRDNRGFVRLLKANASFNVKGKIYVHEQVPQHELLSRLCEHDIGYCGDLSDCQSRDLTVTNKIMEYLRAGLAIIASDTSGHKEVTEMTSGVISLFKQKNVQSLVIALDRLLADAKILNDAKTNSLSSLDGELGWENSSAVLKKTVQVHI